MIRRMSIENPLWGAPRIHGELLKLGFEVAQSSVAKYMVKRRGPPSQGWGTFLRNHAPDIAAMDLFVVPTISFDLLYAFIIIRLDRRDLVWISVTANPTAEWIAHQITEAFPWNEVPHYLIRDRDRIYGTIVTRRLQAMGIRDKPIAPASPWQNGFAERLIGSIRRECLDHLVVLSEAHLRRILQAYARYYNKIRTHRSLDKDAPISRPVQRIGSINSHAILGGLSLRAMGIRDQPISPRSPWQNGIAERLIGTLRRECLDQMVICGEGHLRQILSAYAAYYNQAPYALGITERCAVTSSRPIVWRHRSHSDPGRATSSICPDMIFGKDNRKPKPERSSDEAHPRSNSYIRLPTASCGRPNPRRDEHTTNPGIQRVNHLLALLRRERGGVIQLASGFGTAGLAILQLASWLFWLLAGAIFEVIGPSLSTFIRPFAWMFLRVLGFGPPNLQNQIQTSRDKPEFDVDVQTYTRAPGRCMVPFIRR